MTAMDTSPNQTSPNHQMDKDVSTLEDHITGQAYWRSLEEQANSPALLKQLDDEFQGYDTFAAHAYLVTGVALCVLFTAVKYRTAREQFDQRLKLQAEKRRSERLLVKVGAMRQERLAWLESLARFLRHELRNQVVAVGTSLDLTEQSGLSLDAERYVDRARISLGRMRRLVDSATEATGVEAALAVEKREPVNLSEVVLERVTLLQDGGVAERLEAKVASDVMIEGQEDRIGQLLDKLLENAVEHAEATGRIAVVLKVVGPDAVFSVENQGEPLAMDGASLFDAFVTIGKNGDEGRNLGLGLFIAKAIAEAHGGTISARNLDDSTGARFEVRLPVGVS